MLTPDRRYLGIRVGPWDVEVGDHLEDPIRNALNRELDKQRGAIPCEPVRDELKKLWTQHSFPLDIPDGPQLYVNLEPRALSVSDLLVEQGGLRMIARLGAGAFVSEEPVAGEALGDLPKNEGVAADRGRVDLAVPLALRYDTIRAAAIEALEEQPLVLETEAGEVEVDIEDLEIYPSGERIAIRVNFLADLPWRVFDVSGDMWLTAKPGVEEGGNVVSLSDIEVTRQTDSALWNVLTAAFEERIRGEPESAATIDLTKQKEEAIAALREAVAEADASGVELDLVEPDIRLASIGVGAERLVVEALFTAFIDTSLREIRF